MKNINLALIALTLICCSEPSLSEKKVKVVSGSARATENIKITNANWAASVCGELKSPDKSRRDQTVDAVAKKSAELVCTEGLRGRLVNNNQWTERNRTSTSYNCPKGGTNADCSGSAYVEMLGSCEYEDPTPVQACQLDKVSNHSAYCSKSIVNITDVSEYSLSGMYDGAGDTNQSNVKAAVDGSRSEAKKRVSEWIRDHSGVTSANDPQCNLSRTYSLIGNIYFPRTNVDCYNFIAPGKCRGDAYPEAALLQTCCNTSPECEVGQY